MKQTICIIGAGLCGLASALSIAKKSLGARIQLVDKRRSLTETEGAGIALPANSVYALYQLGLRDALAPFVHEVKYSIYTDANGELLARAAFSSTGGNYPFLAIDRTDLMRVLYSAVSECDNIEIKLGCEFADVQDSLSSYDLVIGADGVHSTVRQTYFPEIEVIDLGVATWRFIAPTPAQVEAQPTYMWGDLGELAMLYPMSPTHSYYYFHLLDSDKHYNTARPSRAKMAQLLNSAFCNFKSFVPDAISSITQDESITIIPGRLLTLSKTCYQHPSINNIILMGDAAHAKTPIIQQGATQGFWDAVVIGETLAEHDSIAGAINTFVNKRQAEMQWAVDRSNGPFKMLSGAIAAGKPEMIYDYIKQHGPLNILGWRELYSTFPYAES